MGVHPNGVVIMDRIVTGGCLMSVFNKYDGNAIFASQYPDYRVDQSRYSQRPHYGQYYYNNSVYDKSIQIELPDNYSVPRVFEVKPF